MRLNLFFDLLFGDLQYTAMVKLKNYKIEKSMVNCKLSNGKLFSFSLCWNIGTPAASYTGSHTS